MGYRRLLQNYLTHVEQLLGSSLVELAPASNLFSKRDLGELRALAAEAAREALRREQDSANAADTTKQAPDLGALMAEAIRSAGLTVPEAAEIAGVATGTINRWCYSEPDAASDGHVQQTANLLSNEEFTRVLVALLAWQRQQHTRPAERASASEHR